MKERILEFLKRENKSSAQFAEEIGVQPSGISHILSGRNNPSLDFVIKMLDKYKYLSTEWLLFGKGEMYRDSAMRNLFEINSIPFEAIEKTENKIQENSPQPSEKAAAEIEKPIQDEGEIEKIVWFYRNNTFREFYPMK